MFPKQSAIARALILLVSSSLYSVHAVGVEPSPLHSDIRLTTLAALPVQDRSMASWTESEVKLLGRQAYVWGWPLVYLHNCRNALALLPAPGRSGGAPVAPPNQLCMLTDTIEPSANPIPCANQDVVYGFSVLDLKDGPIVVQIPDFRDRFWLFQLGDQRTDSFADVGRMYGTAPGFYLIVGPDWEGDLPAGFSGLWRCPTQVGFCIPRVFVYESPEDRQAVQNAIQGIGIYPLSRFTGEPKLRDWSKVRWFPRIGASVRGTSRWVNPEKFFDVLGEVLDEVPPRVSEEAFYAQLRRLLRSAATHPEVREWLVQAAVETEAEVLPPLFEFRNLGRRLPDHWTTLENGGSFQGDFLTRTAVAKSNIFVNRPHEAKYFYLDLDAAGERLVGNLAYRLTFPTAGLPPTRAFWSVTAYDENHLLSPGSSGRTSVGTRSEDLRFNPDGSLTLIIQAEPPAAGESGNWLPPPPGPFSLYLRVYWPETAALTGEWRPPAVTRLATGIP